jgi:hypothetical protein
MTIPAIGLAGQTGPSRGGFGLYRVGGLVYLQARGKFDWNVGWRKIQV